MTESNDDVLLTGSNEIRAYYALDEAMMTAHREVCGPERLPQSRETDIHSFAGR